MLLERLFAMSDHAIHRSHKDLRRIWLDRFLVAVQEAAFEVVMQPWQGGLTHASHCLSRSVSPYISHCLCMIGQICGETRLLFADAVRRGIRRRESA